MKNWIAPAIETVEIACTEYGDSYSTKYDEVRVDQNGKKWYSYSGESVDNGSDGYVEKID
ncbi:MAG: hypothetical protein IJZ82_05120 [Lachnospiraceae bacterium]|nr:hypothetical protein [Lachnospiraceae bacterium]